MTHEVEAPVTIFQRSRPLRFGFLLSGLGDRVGFRTGVRLHTILWGGVYNCFIPVYRRRPNWWDRGPTGPEITRGYLSAFEPDFLVATDPTLAQELEFAPERVLALSDLIRSDRSAPLTHGIGVDELYHHLYKEDFQYQKRRPPEIALPKPTHRGANALVAACFGEFPPASTEAPPYEQIYTRVFDAPELPVTPEELLRLHLERVGFPLSLGASYLRVSPRRRQAGPILFLLDPTSTIDLVDFWTLRALGTDPVPVPVPWFNELRPQLSEFLREHHRPHPDNASVMLATTVVSSRSLGEEDRREYVDALAEEHRGAISFQHWYPRVWDPWARDKDFVLRPQISASEEELEVTPVAKRLTFRVSSLPFSVKSSPYRVTDSVRVIRLRDYGGTRGLATVLPPGLSTRSVLDAFLIDETWVSSEGVVCAAPATSERFYWKLPSAEDVCTSWFAAQGFDLRLTSDGKLAFQAFLRLGGVNGVGLLAKEPLAALLNRMAGGPDRQSYKPSPQSLLGQLRGVTDNDALAAAWLRSLVDGNIIELGVRLKCPHCDQSNWYRLEEIRASLPCHRCLQDYRFPSLDPPSSPWRFRTVGPFAVEDYIHGGFTILLSMRLLAGMSSMYRSELTWCPSFTLSRAEQNLGEIDSLIFLRQDDPYADAIIPLFVEAKSYNSFEDRDVERMQRLGSLWPGVVLAFATLKEKLTQEEIDLIRPLAERGREPLPAGHWQNPVLVLTGRELFSDHGPPACWADLPDELESFARRYRTRSSVQDLCDATQQLYLGMESYGDWLTRRWGLK